MLITHYCTRRCCLVTSHSSRRQYFSVWLVYHSGVQCCTSDTVHMYVRLLIVTCTRRSHQKIAGGTEYTVISRCVPRPLAGSRLDGCHQPQSNIVYLCINIADFGDVDTCRCANICSIWWKWNCQVIGKQSPRLKRECSFMKQAGNFISRTVLSHCDMLCALNILHTSRNASGRDFSSVFQTEDCFPLFYFSNMVDVFWQPLFKWMVFLIPK